MTETIEGPDGQPRCRWASSAPDFFAYHDTEWGYPVVNDIRLFEKVCLESFQSGLSWRTILTKRENFRAAFAGFDFYKVASFDETDVARLLGDAGIVRHRGKIEATINNAKRAVEMVEAEGTLAAYFWRFEPKAPPAPQSVTTIPEAAALAKNLKRRGWKFFGPTTAFAFMQAMGLVNDHATGCCMRDKAAKLRASFTPPT